MNIIIKDTDVDGISLVYRRESELPFAQLTAPRAMPLIPGRPPTRLWGVRYRDGDNPDDPFKGCFIVSPKNLADAIYEMERCVRACSDYQLGLSDTP